MINHLSVILALASAINAAPLPALITRYHTAPAVTTTQTYTTGTTTVWLPPVEVLISNGDTYTFTMTNEEWGTTASTRTSIVNKGAEPTNTPAPEAQTTPETTQAQTTQAQTSQAQTTQAPAPQNTPQTSSTQAPQPTTSSTQAPQPTTSSTQAQASAPAPSSPAGAPQPSSASPGTSANEPQTTFSQPNQQTTATTSSTTTSSSQTQQPSATADAGTISPPSSIVYSPYADNGGCKDQSTIDSDLQMIFNKGIRKVRIYGGDCNLYTATLPKCAQLGIKVNQGLYFTPSGPDSIDQDVSNLIDYGKSNGWGVFDFITVGNEAINDKRLSVQQLLSKISSVKSQLRSNGYSGDVTTSEPPVSFSSHPELCDSSSPIDIVGINPHSYFDADVDASQAGSFVAGQKSLVEGVCGSKQVVITETGYPSKGNTNGKNIPSVPNQETAIKSIIDATGGDVTILTTYNDFWKSPGPYGIEQYFGTITLFQ